ncbi:hypothetical protein Mapa_002367 [Marchantia paleacea]|nr:hypothetical protein Mapa_002367 [Marchantia paleacea]
MGWLRSLLRSFFTSDISGGRSTRLCLCPCDVMAPCTRSRSRASIDRVELDSDSRETEKKDLGGLPQNPQRPVTRASKRSRKDDLAVDDSKKQGARGSSPGGDCWICKDLEAKDPFTTGCGHTYCRTCIVEYVRKVVKSQMAVLNPTYPDLKAQVMCPNSSCKEELSQRELTVLLGAKAVRVYGKWLATILDKFYRPSLIKDARVECTNIKCTQGVPTVVLSSKVSDIGTTKVRHALQVRGIQRKCMKQQCVRLLLNTVGLDEKEANRAVWICTTCEAAWCVACGVQIPLTSKNDKSKGHAHCEGVQRYEVYKSLVDLNEACSIYTLGLKTHNFRKSKSGGSGKTIWADGTGFGGDYIESKHHSEAMQAAARKAELELDNRVEKQLSLLTRVLKGDGEGEEGTSPRLSVATCALFRWDNILSQLLRQLATNDSMLDISERSSLYLKMVDLLKAIRMHDELLPVLLGCSTSAEVSDKECDVAKSMGLKVVSNITPPEGEEDISEDKDNTVMRKLANIYKQAKVMLQRMQSGSLEGTAAADVDMSLARELCQCYEVLLESAMKEEDPVIDDRRESTEVGVSTRSRGRRLESEEVEAKTKMAVSLYKEKLRGLQFKQLPMADANGEYRHHFKDHITGKVANSTCIDKRGSHNHKRMLHLSKEIASLATTLPLEWESSIHLCVDESRADVLRAMIVGPQGTPYQNGLFMFDIFLPPDYPQVPPNVHFLTTGGGKVRFNPNLYDSGKICLSLLGTWSGPGWVPGKSTLLQVLVSIQSLIFVKDPYYNEPGFEQTKSPEAEKENSRHREHTLSLAVLGALRKPDPLFADVVREHFLLKREEMEQQCDDWIAVTAEGYAKHRITNIAKEVKAELEVLCSSKD